MSTTITLIRHATVVIGIGDQRVLVDPMLDPAGRRGPIANSPEPRADLAAEHPDVTFVAVHMDAINHCLDTREVLAERLGSRCPNVVVPDDGETVAVNPSSACKR